MDDKKTQIFSDEMHEQYSQFSLRVRGDTSGIAKLTLFVLATFTALLLFWWKLVGAPIEYLYVVNWFQRYPTTPIQESVTWNILQGMEVITTVFLAVTWLYIILYAITFFSAKKLKEPEQKIGLTPQSDLLPEICTFCNSTHTRQAGKTHSDKRYCMSCRRYYK